MYFKDNRGLTLIVPPAIQDQIDIIVKNFNSEVSWFGDITVEDDVITIEKIYLFPQVVTGGTFRTDTPEVSDLYDEWYCNKLDEMMAEAEAKGTDPKPIMQYNGHSHYNSACVPSSEDIKYRNSREGLNVYSIHNKKGDMDWEIWTDDMVWEVQDIFMSRHNKDLSDTLKNAKEYVLSPKTTSSYSSKTTSSYNNKTVSHKTGLAGDQTGTKADEKKNDESGNSTTPKLTQEEIDEIAEHNRKQFERLEASLNGKTDTTFAEEIDAALDDLDLKRIEEDRINHGYGHLNYWQ